MTVGEKKRMKDEYITREQAAAILKCSVVTVDSLSRRIKDGKPMLQRYRRPFGVGIGGRRIFFKRSEVEQLARQGNQFQPN